MCLAPFLQVGKSGSILNTLHGVLSGQALFACGNTLILMLAFPFPLSLSLFLLPPSGFQGPLVK